MKLEQIFAFITIILSLGAVAFAAEDRYQNKVNAEAERLEVLNEIDETRNHLKLNNVEFSLKLIRFEKRVLLEIPDDELNSFQRNELQRLNRREAYYEKQLGF